MKVLLATDRCALFHGEAGQLDLPENSIDSIVVDPPSGISFMGASWDTDKGGRDRWIAWLAAQLAPAYRALKPGGHAVVWALPRTSHWTALAIEDIGFVIRDCIYFIFGSGFPKNLDVSKQIDKSDAGERRRRALAFTSWMRSTGLTSGQIDAITGTHMGGHYTAIDSQPAVATREHLELLRPHVRSIPAEIEELVGQRVVLSERFARREVLGHEVMTDVTKVRAGFAGATFNGDDANLTREVAITAPLTDEARQWAGWGTALKPACEVWWLARKPLVDTVAANVLEYGTGAINIDACRVGADVRHNHPAAGGEAVYGLGIAGGEQVGGTTAVGRWPAHLIMSHHDECREVGTVDDAHEVRVGPRTGDDSRGLAFGMGAQATTTTTTTRVVYECHVDCPARILDEQSGTRKSGTRKSGTRKSREGFTRGDGPADGGPEVVGSTGGASRFFYCAKPARSEKDEGLEHLPKRSGGDATDREEGSAGLNSPRAGAGRNGGVRNVHPTAKSVALMTWLIKLITPPGGTVVDPFAGSGTTGVAALRAGFNFIGVELGNPAPDDLAHHHEYLPIILGRLRHALALPQHHPAQDPALAGVEGWWSIPQPVRAIDPADVAVTFRGAPLDLGDLFR